MVRNFSGQLSRIGEEKLVGAVIMSHPRRMFIHNKPYLVTNRVAEGLPFVANRVINLIIYGILARAKFKYPSVKICAWVFLANHFHGIIIPSGDPEDASRFMDYVDGQLAKAVKLFLGKRTNCKIWEQRYHAAILLTQEDVIDKFVYTLGNPVIANLVARASDWFGVTTFDHSWDTHSRHYKLIRLRHIPVFPNAKFTRQSVQDYLEALDKCKAPKHKLTIEPMAWLGCFPNEKPYTKEKAAIDIQHRLAVLEQSEATKRTNEKRSLPSQERLELQNPRQSYIPEKRGRRVICICSCVELRLEFIELYKEFCKACVRAYKDWKEGVLNVTYPPGAILPPGFKRADIVFSP